jgi:pimeloyl-ACP methyl ester carboxylesterase
VILYDIRGHARSGKADPVEAFSMECLVQDMGRVATSHAVGKLIVGGLSLGAAVALHFALRFPDRVSGLMLAAYPAEPATLRSWALAFAEKIAKNGVEAAGEEFVWGAASRFDESARRLIKAGFLEHSPGALAGLLTQCLAELSDVTALSDALRQLPIPTSIVVGSADVGSVTPCLALARLIPEATLTVLEGAGHVVNLERAAEFNAELQELLNRVDTHENRTFFS